MTTPLIEAIARAIAEGQGDDFDHAHRDKPHWIETRGESGGRYRDINEPRQPDFLDAAQAALTAITEAGYAVVPKTVTPQLLDALDDEAPAVGCCIMDRRTATEIYDLMVFRAMISAAQGDG